MHHWEDLYQNPPLSKDAALFGLAVLLHLPLFLVKMKAPPDFSQGAAPLVNVAILERIDEQVTLVRPAPALAPERPAVDLNQYRKVLEDIQKSRVKNLPPIPASTMRDIKVDTARKELLSRSGRPSSGRSRAGKISRLPKARRSGKGSPSSRTRPPARSVWPKAPIPRKDLPRR